MERINRQAYGFHKSKPAVRTRIARPLILLHQREHAFSHHSRRQIGPRESGADKAHDGFSRWASI
jgi:hypothetical protein